MRCGNLAPARLGTASIPARTVPSTSDHSRSTASALSSEPAACAALSSARSACAFAAFSPSLAWVQALAQNTPPPSQRCLKDAFTSKPQALLATVHVIAGPAAKQRAAAYREEVLYTLANDEPTVNALPLAAVSDPRRVADQTALC